MGYGRSGFTQSHQTAGAGESSGCFKRYLLRSTHWMSVALFTQELSALEDGLFLLLALAEKRGVGSSAGDFTATCARPTGTTSPSPCSQCGLPEREDHGKRGPRGFDGNKRLKGRKRFALSDAGGNWLESVVLPANTGERQGALVLLRKVKAASWSEDLKLIWADEGFAGVDFEAQIQAEFGWQLDIGQKEPGQKAFCVQRKRWLIEQLFGCWGRYRRLSRDYEANPECSRATLQVATLHRWLNRLKPKPFSDPPFRYRKA